MREVVLPYLNNVGGFQSAARDATSGVLSGQGVAMLADIPGWFGARGVERVTFIELRSDDDEGEGPGPDLPDGAIEGRVEGARLRPMWPQPRPRKTPPPLPNISTEPSRTLSSPKMA